MRLLPANAEKLFALVEQEGVLNTTVVLTGVAPSGAPAVARRRVQPDEFEPQYAQPQYGQPQYGSRNMCSRSMIAYGRPVYGNPYYAQPQYRDQYGRPYWCSGPATCTATPMASPIVQPRGSMFPFQ